LHPLVEEPAPSLDQRVRQALAGARAGVAAIGVPLEEAARSRRFTLLAAAVATRTLERSFRVDLASALGVTVTFTSGDGD
jgi:predicted lipoprotein